MQQTRQKKSFVIYRCTGGREGGAAADLLQHGLACHQTPTAASRAVMQAGQRCATRRSAPVDESGILKAL